MDHDSETPVPEDCERQSSEAGAIEEPWRDIARELETIANQLLAAIPQRINDAPLNQLTSTLKFTHETLQSIRANQLRADSLVLDFSKMTDEQLEQLESLTAYLLGNYSGVAVPERPGAPAAAEAASEPALPAGLESLVPAALFPPAGDTDHSGVPELHRWLSERLAGFHEHRHSRLALIAPRESAKTTWITLAYVLRCAIEDREQYILLLSDSRQQAEKYLMDIRKELEGAGEADAHEQQEGLPDSPPPALSPGSPLAAVYPEACGRGPEWRKDHLLLRNGVLIECLSRG